MLKNKLYFLRLPYTYIFLLFYLLAIYKSTYKLLLQFLYFECSYKDNVLSMQYTVQMYLELQHNRAGMKSTLEMNEVDHHRVVRCIRRIKFTINQKALWFAGTTVCSYPTDLPYRFECELDTL